MCPPHLCLSLLVDNNRPYTLFVIDDRAATFHLWPVGAALTSGLTSWDSCKYTGMHLMTPGQEKAHWWKVKSRCPTATVTSGRDWICWLTDRTVDWAERDGEARKSWGSVIKDYRLALLTDHSKGAFCPKHESFRYWNQHSILFSVSIQASIRLNQQKWICLMLDHLLGHINTLHVLFSSLLLLLREAHEKEVKRNAECLGNHFNGNKNVFWRSLLIMHSSKKSRHCSPYKSKLAAF